VKHVRQRCWMQKVREATEPLLAVLSNVRSENLQSTRMNAYAFCPLMKKLCIEGECAWWLDVGGEGGCSLRCLGALVTGEILCHKCRKTLKLVMNSLYAKKLEHT
jgi:hypothetical protein